MNRVTMQDVAAKSGVSVSTVCRALRFDSQIPPATRERIQKIADSLGYRPDPLISAFASRRRGKSSDITTIAYVTSFPDRNKWQSVDYYSECFRGASSRAEKLGYRVEHFWLKEPGMSGKRLSRILYERGISAVCIPPMPNPRGHLTLDWHRFVSVTLGYSLLRPELSRATPHHYHGMMLALRELRRGGYTRIGLSIDGNISKRVNDLWFAAALLHRQRYPEVTLQIFFHELTSMHKVAAWVKKEKLQVIISDTGKLMGELQKAGMKVPGDIDYVTLLWDRKHPEIAGIDQRADMIGAAAVDLIVSQQQRGEFGLPEVPTTLMVDGRWIGGKSAPRATRKSSKLNTKDRLMGANITGVVLKDV